MTVRNNLIKEVTERNTSLTECVCHIRAKTLSGKQNFVNIKVSNER